MPENLVIRLASSGQPEASWMVVDIAGTRLSSIESGALASAAPHAEQRRVFVLVPGAEVVLTRAQLPLRSTAKLLQAVPFALEEQFAEDVDSLHFAIGKRRADGTVPVAVTARECMDRWLAQLAAARIEADCIVPDTLGIPVASGGATLVVDGSWVLVGRDGSEPLMFETDALGEVLETAGLIEQPAADDEEEQDAGTHLSVYLAQAGHERYAPVLEEMRKRVASLQIRLLPEGPLPNLAVTVVGQPALNLRQGLYAARTSREKLWHPWRAAAVTLAVLFAVSLGAKAVEAMRLQAEEQQLDASIERVLRETFPGIQRVVNPRVQFSQGLATVRGTVASGEQMFLGTLGALAAVLVQAPNIRIESISFRNNVMSLELMAPDVAALDRISRSLAEGTELEAEIKSANPDDDGRVEGRLELRRAER